MSNVDNPLDHLRAGLDSIAVAVEAVANQPAPEAVILDRSLTGNKIHGGTITKFASVGIDDHATLKSLLIDDSGIHTNAVFTKSLMPGEKLTVNGGLEVRGEITATKLHVNEITSDIRNERTGPLEFLPEGEKGIYNKGIHWKGNDSTKQLVFKSKPDRFWSTESIDIVDGKTYNISNATVLSIDELGPSVRKSSLTSVGTLQELRTQGDLVIDDYIYYNSSTDSLGMGTENPKGKFSIATLDGEFYIDPDIGATTIGNWTTTDLSIVTDNTPRITIKANGGIILKDTVTASKIGIGVNNIQEGVSLATSGPIQIQNKKMEVGSAAPTTGLYQKGDIVWNELPAPTGYVGWICVREGNPGEWKPFGQISK